MALIAGILAADALMPILFRRIPNDLSRVALILDALHAPDLGPAVVIFGSSVIASAIDTRRLGDELPGHPKVLSLASAAQTLTESFLFYQEIPSSVRAIVQTLTPRELVDLPRLKRNKFNAFYMYGYRPNERTRRTLESVLAAESAETIDASDVAQRFRARWSMHELLNTRQWRRNRLAPEADRWMTDISFVHLFDDPVPPAVFESGLELWLSSWNRPDPDAIHDTRLLLVEMADVAARGGHRLIVLVPPMHPRVRDAIPPSFLSAFDELLRDVRGRASVEIIDTSNLLPASGFRDCVHVLSASAPLVTDRLADRLREGAL